MRYVPLTLIKEGMILGKTLYGNNGEVLLTKNTPILLSYVKALINLGYCGIYINDKLSDNITVNEIINEDLKIKAIKSIKNLMQPNINKKEIQSSLKIIENLMENIVDEISCNKDIMINMIDLKIASEYTFYHSVNVCVLSIVLGVALKF
jgi:HD-GYP domain-containing protein (c-di-GMP phosphodiesterase class II)